MEIRPLDTTRDFPALSALLAARDPEPPTPALLAEWEGNAPAGLIRQRLVAFDDQGVLIGHSDAASWPWELPGQFWLSVVVAPDARHRGLGARLAEQSLAFAHEQSAARLDAEVRDNNIDSLRFAEHLGFQMRRHIFESRLALATFDDTPFGGALQHAEAAGVHFITLADLGDTEAAQRRLYAINATLARDVPGREGDFMPFDQFRKTVCSASWYRPDGQIIAVAGENWIGMAAVGYFENTNSMYNMFTGVDPSWRGKGIALALKLLAIGCARGYGADSIRTNNDSENAPMLAVNRKLGYQPEPGFYVMLRQPAFG